MESFRRATVNAINYQGDQLTESFNHQSEAAIEVFDRQARASNIQQKQIADSIKLVSHACAAFCTVGSAAAMHAVGFDVAICGAAVVAVSAGVHAVSSVASLLGTGVHAVSGTAAGKVTISAYVSFCIAKLYQGLRKK